jgi:hypothetical protein
MDMLAILQELRSQREKLVKTIAAMESLRQSDGTPSSSVPAKRRGRKFMGEEERERVSKRMHKYWESQHKTATGAGAGNDLHAFELNPSQGDHRS